MEQKTEIEQPVVQQNSSTAENKKVADKPAEESVEQINWRKYREQREIERKQKDEAEKRAREKEAEALALKQAMEALLAKPEQSRQNEMVEDDSQEAIIERKINERLLEREKRADEERRTREHQDMPKQLHSAYNDFGNVCTTENLDYLEYHYPEVATAFKHMPDSFEKWSSVYKAIKKFIPNSNSGKDKSKAEKNSMKPQSMASPGATQTGDTAPVKLDEKRRQDNWARMQRVMKGI